MAAAGFARSVVALTAALSALGCAVGPNYSRPELRPPQQFRFAESTTQAESLADAPTMDAALTRLHEPQTPPLRQPRAERSTNALSPSSCPRKRVPRGGRRGVGLPGPCLHTPPPRHPRAER